MQTRTYGDLFKLASALIGTGGQLSDGEQDQLSHFINRRFSEIFNASPSWPRYVVVGEPRTVTPDQTIQTSEDSFYVYGAGTTEANGLYVRNGDSPNGLPAYTLYDSDGITVLYNIWSDGGPLLGWYITSTAIGNSGDVLYSQFTSQQGVPESGWSANNGVSPTPIVQTLSEIGEAIGYWGASKWEGNDPLSLTAYPDSNGIRVASNVTGTIYVAYKKAWSDTYGNGESGTLATVPTEWAEFMAYDAARSYRASQGGEDGFNPIALRDVNNALERALMKVSRSGAIAALTNQLKTQYSVDESV
jgi:hypothetical protein